MSSKNGRREFISNVTKFTLAVGVGNMLSSSLVHAEDGTSTTLTKKDRDKLLGIARKVIDDASLCSLTTFASNNLTSCRTMHPFAPQDDFSIWLGTKPNSRKIRQIRNNPNVSLYYLSDKNRGYVTLNGKAEIVNTDKMKQKWWREKWAKLYPTKRTDYILIKFSPVHMEVISYVLGEFGNKDTWAPKKIGL